MKVLLVLFIAVIVILLLCLVIGYGTMRFVIYPKRTSYEEAEQIEKSKGYWGDYDSYEKEAFNVTSFDGYVLHGELIKGVADRYVIITHGYTYNMLGSIKYVHMFHKLGYNVYIYDLRHFGKNDESFCSMGWYESRDIIAVAGALRQRFGNNISIGLHGESLGCASSLMALGMSQEFEFLIADCGFVDLHKLLADQAKKMLHMPSFIVFFTDFWMKRLHHYRFAEVRPIDALENNNVPILFIHGAADDFILPEHTKQAYEACRSYKRISLVEGAGHAQSYEKDPAEYETNVTLFLEDIHKREN
ncbi:MAG: alpha/beta hydrolase [Lachnospiraceae bacterium]|nr:alpha/beta hydrolase [Lachnospiraceae bacterium]